MDAEQDKQAALRIVERADEVLEEAYERLHAAEKHAEQCRLLLVTAKAYARKIGALR